eukprot:CAMPEP_0185596346 /NCGR_PEP_ID=MMETSP0434-20130131/80702_1 /TAXON_ID=626734 ORGANISM="Favella taraikaensis, Strain Fe Narragansett Bay" /NCGR_SAMPLE_ID=MMETSP0434 /ASSEMBLY_ACC=CAM_ASM_000379 /LENGTH=203 /DNA_ID=CAMNT_0028224831 /DNA_START=1858 /DNA_END=2471 /DNA_ORIENTATION=-
MSDKTTCTSTAQSMGQLERVLRQGHPWLLPAPAESVPQLEVAAASLQSEEYGAAPANDRELKDLLRKVEKKNESDAMRLNRMYNEIMDQQEPEKKYMTRRRKIANNLKSKSYWPDGMKHPDQYRGFYWTNDLAFCGFATLSHQEKTIGMIKKAIDSTTNKSVQGAAASKKPPMSTKRAFAKVQTKMNAKERVYKSPLSAQNPT